MIRGPLVSKIEYSNDNLSPKMWRAFYVMDFIFQKSKLQDLKNLERVLRAGGWCFDLSRR
jgi:hypothetical protein